MNYPGDLIPFVLSLATPTGSAAVVTTPPYISILNAADDSALDIAGAGIKTAVMPLIAGSDAIYKFLWPTTGVPDGSYIAVVSYVANGVTANSRFLAEVKLGDARITHEVPAASTTAKTSDLPDKTQVLLKTDFVAPSADASVQAILAKVNALPANVASQDSLQALLSLVADIRDAELGSWAIDKSVSPNRLTLYRIDGTALQSFDLSRTDAAALRTRR